MDKKLLSVFGLKWDPFSPNVPIEALHITPRVENFCWRTENLARAESPGPSASCRG